MTGRRDLGRRSGSAAPGGVRAHHRRDVPVGLALSVRLRRDSRSRSQPRCALRSPPASGRPRAAGRRAGRRHQPGRRGWIGLRWNGQEFPGAVGTIQQDAVRVLAERDPPRRMGRPRPATSNGRGTPGQSPRSTVVRMKRPRVCGAVSSGGSSVGKPRVRGHQAPSNCPWGCGAGPARGRSGIGRAGGSQGPDLVGLPGRRRPDRLTPTQVCAVWWRRPAGLLHHTAHTVPQLIVPGPTAAPAAMLSSVR